MTYFRPVGESQSAYFLLGRSKLYLGTSAEDRCPYCFTIEFGQYLIRGLVAQAAPDGIKRIGGQTLEQGATGSVTAPVTMEYGPPPPELADRISSLYAMQQDSVDYDEVERSDRPQFRIMLSGGGKYHFQTGAADPAFLVTIMGPTSGTVRGIGFGPMDIVGAGLNPAAWVALMGADADRWVDRAIDATAVFGDSAMDLFEAVRLAASTQDRFTLICDFLDQATKAADTVAPFWFIRLVDEWLLERFDPQVETLVERTGLGMRQIERLSKRYYGLPPKTLARKYRALRAAAALARGDSLDDLGMGESFYDQSHLIRELKRFAGLTPQQIKNRESSLLTEISTGRKSLAGLVGTLVSDA